MGEFIHSVQVSRTAVGASDTTVSVRMPVLPLTAIYITLDCVPTSANTSDSWTTILNALTSVQFQFRGTQIWSVSGTDLYRITRALGLFGYRPEVWGNLTSTPRQLTLCLPFGRKLYDPTECFPAVAQGETNLQISFTAAPSGYQTLFYTVESVQLIDGAPTNFIRATTISDTPVATGDKDYDLPRAAPLVGIGVNVAATFPNSTSPTLTQCKILANNQDYMYAQATPSVLRAMQSLRRSIGYEMDAWTAISNTAASYTQNAAILTQRDVDSPTSNFVWMPFDIYGDGNYMAPAQLFQDLKLRLTYAATGAVRILPIEFWDVNMLTRSKSNPAAAPIPRKLS